MDSIRPTARPGKAAAKAADALDALADMIAERVAARLAPAHTGADGYVTPATLPPGTSMRSLHGARRRGEIVGTRSGRGWAYRRSDVERWLAARTERRQARTPRRAGWAAELLAQRGYVPGNERGSVR